ncbi:hypothetical protein Tco_0155347 [Tanacetum coccineum]
MATNRKAPRLNPGTTPPPDTDSNYHHFSPCPTSCHDRRGCHSCAAVTATTRKGDDSHISGTGVRRNETRYYRECTVSRLQEMVNPYSSGVQKSGRLDPVVREDGNRVSHNEILNFQETEVEITRDSLNINRAPRPEKYLLQGCHRLIGTYYHQETGDKSKKKQLQDVTDRQKFPKVLPRTCHLPPTRQDEFHIDLVPGAAPVARAPYRLAPQK